MEIDGILQELWECRHLVKEETTTLDVAQELIRTERLLLCELYKCGVSSFYSIEGKYCASNIDTPNKN